MRCQSISVSVLSLVACCATLVFSQSAEATTYYVRTSGNDSNPGTTATKAFRTIKKAATVAQAGDIVWVGKGTYPDSVSFANSGQVHKVIQFQADITGAYTGDAGQPVVAGGGSSTFIINSEDYIQIYGFQFGGTSTNSGYSSNNDDDETVGGSSSVRCFSGKGILFKNCEFFNNTDGIWIDGAEVTLENCEIRNHSHNGILCEGPAKMTVRWTLIKECDQKGIYIKRATAAVIEESTITTCGNHGIRTESLSASETLDVRRCEILSNGKDGIHIHGGSKVSLENCLFAHNDEEGVHNHSGNGTVNINHCTMVSNGNDGIDNDQANFTCTITNSIFAFNGDDGIDNKRTKFTHSYNLAYGNRKKEWEGCSATKGCVSSDPKFVSLTDFHLKPGSGAIDRGTGNMSVALDGTPRPLGTAVDIGCHEGLGGGAPVPPNTKEYFVRVGGSDAKNGRTPATAFRTIAKAVSVVLPGETVWVGSGKYTEALDISAKLGTSTNPIRFIADETGAKTGDAGEVSVVGGFYLLNSNHVTVDGFAIQVGNGRPKWSLYDSAVYVSGSTNIFLQNLTTTAGNYGISTWTSTNVQVAGCTASGASSHGFAFFPGSTASVRSCKSMSNTSAGFYVEKANIQLSDCDSSGNNARGFQYVTAQGSVSNCSSFNDALAGDFTGINNDPASLNVTNFDIQSSRSGGLRLVSATADVTGGTNAICTSGPYGASLDNAILTLRSAVVTGTQYGVQAINGSHVRLTDCKFSACQYDGLSFNGGTATLNTCSITGCRSAIQGLGNGTLSATDCLFDASSSWAVRHTGLGSLSDCTVNKGLQGLYLVGATTRGDITLANVTIQGPTQEALYAVRCTGSVVGGNDKLSKGGAYGVYMLDSDLTFQSVDIAGPQYGFMNYSGDLNVSNSKVSACLYDAFYADSGSTDLTNCSVIGCRYGVRSENNSSLAATTCTFESNKAWAISHSGTGSVSNTLVKNNYQGLYLAGPNTAGDITITNTVIDGTSREALAAIHCTGDVRGGAGKFSQGGSYGAYLSQSDLVIADVDIAGPSYGVISYSSKLQLSDASIVDCASDGIYGSQATTTLTNCSIARCLNGINSQSNGTLNASNSSLDACKAWGITHSGYGSIKDCVVNNCNQGMYLIGVSQPTDIQVTNGKIQGTAKEGLIAIRASGNIIGGTDLLSKGGNYGAYLSAANFKLANVSMTAGQRGVVSLNSTLDLQNASVTATTQTGLYGEGSTVNLSNSTFSGCGTRGIDCRLDSKLTATSCTVEDCNDWALVVAGFGTINSCQLNDNRYGANLTGKSTRGDIKLTDLTINNCADQGLVAVRCDGNVRGGSGTFSRAGDWGLYSNDSKLTVTNATITGSVRGVQSTLSNLTLRDMQIANTTNGIYSDRDQNVVVERTRLENSSTWGLWQLQGSSQLTNCLVINNANGMYYENTNQANLWNTTVVATGNYGIYQTAGVVDLKNTIVTGNEQGIGIYRAGGVMTSSHNLVHGFATNFSGVTPDSNTLVKNPRFNNAAGGDYTLAMGSPAINAGIDVLGYVDSDFAGNPRPTKKRWEIGAYESLLEGASLRVLEWSEKR